MGAPTIDAQRKPSQLRKLLIFSGISLVSLGLVFALTYNEQTVDALRQLNPRYLFFLAAIWFAAISLDALSFWFYTRGTDEHMSVLSSYKSATLRIFFNIITPFSFGGQPFVIYFLQKTGIPTGKATSVVFTKLIIVSVYVLIGAIVAFFVFPGDIGGIPAVNTIFLMTMVLQILFIALLVLSMFYPHAVIRALQKLGNLVSRFNLIKNPGHFRKRVLIEANVARRSFRKYFRQHLLSFALGTLVMGLMYVAEASMLFIVFRGLGVNIPYMHAIALGALLIFIISFMPTPGSAGLGEALFVLVFSGAAPSYVLGIAVILWRLFYNYISAGFGALFSSQTFSGIFKRRPVAESPKD